MIRSIYKKQYYSCVSCAVQPTAHQTYPGQNHKIHSQNTVIISLPILHHICSLFRPRKSLILILHQIQSNWLQNKSIMQNIWSIFILGVIIKLHEDLPFLTFFLTLVFIWKWIFIIYIHSYKKFEQYPKYESTWHNVVWREMSQSIFYASNIVISCICS